MPAMTCNGPWMALGVYTWFQAFFKNRTSNSKLGLYSIQLYPGVLVLVVEEASLGAFEGREDSEEERENSLTPGKNKNCTPLFAEKERAGEGGDLFPSDRPPKRPWQCKRRVTAYCMLVRAAVRV